MADTDTNNDTVDQAAADAHAKIDEAAVKATSLIERAQDEAKALLGKATEEASALLGRTIQAAKNNPKLAAGIAAGAAATIAGGAYAATKLRSSAKTTTAKPRAPRKTPAKATPKKG